MCAFSCVSPRNVEISKHVEGGCGDAVVGDSNLLELLKRQPQAAAGEDAAELPMVAVATRRRFQEDFKKLDLLGRGAFGEVWRCLNLVDGKEYGVKIVKYRAGRSIEQHVMREAQALQMMRHPNVLHYHDAWIETEERTERSVSGDSADGWASGRPRLPTWTTPPPSPAQHPLTPKDFILDGTAASCFSYDCGSLGSCNSGVIFCDFQEDEAGSAADSEDEKLTATPPKSSPELSAASGSLSGLANRGPFVRQETGPFLEPASTLYIQVELCREDTLQGWIEKRNEQFASGSKLDKSAQWAVDALSIFMECVNALTHVHRRSCVHRDVKPSNILFSRRHGNVRLGDFGLAKVLSSDGAANSPTERRSSAGSPSPPSAGAAERASDATRGTVGTPSYASPEQLGGCRLSAATDVYALGLVLAELVCPVRTQMERAAVLEGLRVRREVPAATAAAFPALAKLAVQMTEPEPSARPTAREILRVARQVFRELRRSSATCADEEAEVPVKVSHRSGRCRCSHFQAAIAGRWRRPASHHRRQTQRAAAAQDLHALQFRPAGRARGRPPNRVALACAAAY